MGGRIGWNYKSIKTKGYLTDTNKQNGKYKWRIHDDVESLLQHLNRAITMKHNHQAINL